MSNTRNEHSFVQKTKLEESNRLTFIVLIVAICIGLYGMVKIQPFSNETVGVIPGKNEIVKASISDNILKIQEIGKGKGKIRFEIVGYDARKKYIMEMGDGKVVPIEKKVFSYRYKSKGFFTVKLTEETKKGKKVREHSEIITITR